MPGQSKQTSSASAMNDERFAKIVSDPKFRRMPEKARKVKVDSRFSSMFSDSRFKLNYSVDKRGRPVDKSSKEDLKQYYELESDEQDEKEETNVAETSQKKPLRKGKKIKREEESGSEDEESGRDEEKSGSENEVENSEKSDRGVVKLDLARGEGNMESSDDSSDDDEEDEEWDRDDQSAALDHWGELDKDAPAIEEATSRLAICNMDWANVRARDLYVLLNSFKPPTGLVRSVKIYPSEFGKARMAEEEVNGPPELAEIGKRNQSKNNLADEESGSSDEGNESNDDDDDDDNPDNSELTERLREYEINRLKYYYAIVECDSAETANAIYSGCDGLEYESSALRLDLRFVPPDTQFDENEIKDAAAQGVDLGDYKPRLFTNSALQQQSVRLTWEAPDLQRRHALRNAFDPQVLEKAVTGGVDYLQNMIASSSSEAESEPEDMNGQLNDEQKKERKKVRLEKYRSLLQAADIPNETEKSSSKVDIIWEPGLPDENVNDQPDEILMGKSAKIPKNSKTKLLPSNKKREINTMEANSDSDSDLYSNEDADSDTQPEQPGKPLRKRQKLSKKGRRKAEAEPLSPEAELEKTRREAELKLLLRDDVDQTQEKKNYDLKKLLTDARKRKKNKKASKVGAGEEKKAEDFSVNLNDERFRAVFDQPEFNIEPSDPAFKKTLGMEKLLDEKQRRVREKVSTKIATQSRETKIVTEEASPINPELKSLIQSVKSRTNVLEKRRKKART